MSTIRSRYLLGSRSLFFALLTSVALMPVGCGGRSTVAGTGNGTGESSSASIRGVVMGGPFPMQRATVTLYATQSNGYGGTGLVLATTTTGSDGSYSIDSSSYTCPAGQQAYIAAVGGAVGANSNNPNAIQMTAIGPCSSLVSGMYIAINGPTTIAAAYALDNFITIEGNIVNISAPANNNAATGGCTGSGTSMKCLAAGLPHAFLNALTLVNGVGATSALPTGAPNQNPPQNPGSTDLIASLGAAPPTGTNPYTLGNTIPVPNINSLSNIMQDCVNSTGGVSGDGSNCGTLFLNATPSDTYSASTTAPTNTLKAMMNIARFPFVNVSALYALASANNYYQPALTAAPVDWSIAIEYRSIPVNSAATSLGLVFNVALDANDNVFVSANSAGTSPTGSGAVPVLVSQLTSNGAGNWQTSLDNSTLCATNLTGNLCNEAVDSVGNVYLADSGYLYQLSAAGTATAFDLALTASETLRPVNVAVDRYDNLFVATYNSTTTSGTTANLVTYPAGSTGITVPAAVTANGADVSWSPIPGGLNFDSNGDLGVTLYGGSNMYTYVLPNIGTTSTVFGAPEKGTLSASSTDTQMECVIFDANNNLYSFNLANLYMLAAGSYTGIATEITGSGGSQMRLGVIDGGGTLWVADPTTGGGAIRAYYSTLATPSFGAITSCLPWGGNSTTATSTSTATTSTASTLCNPAIWNGGSSVERPERGDRSVVVDSTGAIWAGAGNNFAVTQVLGAAAPTWPLASYAHFGAEPQ